MRRLAIALAAAVALTAPAAAHARSDNGAKPVLLMTGEETGSVDCKAYWSDMTARLKRFSMTVQGATVKFTGGFQPLAAIAGPNCPQPFRDGSLEEQAKQFSDWLRLTYKGEDVDVVAQGTAGVMIRYAVAQAAKDGAPLAIEDVVTLGAPHAGSAALAAKCASPVCAELAPGSALLAELAGAEYMNPQGAHGTDWTVIGSAGDELVKADSAIAMDADHKTVYTKPALKHEALHGDASAARDATISYSHRGTDTIEWRKAPHVADRVGGDLITGSTPVSNASGCTGSNDTPGGPVRVDDPGLLQFTDSRDQLSYIKSGILEAYSLCFRRSGDTLISDTKVRLNGLDIVPAAGTRIVIDPKTRHVTAEKMTMTIPSQWFGAVPIPLASDAPLDWYVPKAAGSLSGSDLDGFGANGSAKLAGFPVKGSHKLTLVQGATQLELNVGLPGIFSGTGWTAPGQENKAQCTNGIDDDGDGKTDYPNDKDCTSPADDYESAADGLTFIATIRADNVRGLMLDKVGGTIEGNFKLGSLPLRSASVWYSRADDEWEISATVALPLPKQPTLKATIGIKNGSLKSLVGEVDNLNFGPLGESPFFLQRVKLGFALQPAFELQLGTTLSFLERYPDPDKGWISLAEWAGDLTISGSSTKLTGKLLVLGSEWGNGSLEVKYGDATATTATLIAQLNKYLEYKAGDNKLKLTINGGATGVADATRLDVTSKSGLCFEGGVKFGPIEGTIKPSCLLQSQLRLSGKKGLFAGSACGQLDLGVYTMAVGAAFRHVTRAGGDGEWNGKTFAGACDVDDWHTNANASQAGGASAVTLGSGLNGAVIGIQGQGAPPRVALTGPGGAKVPAASGDAIVRGNGYAVIPSTGDSTTYVVLGKPAGGRWTVQPQPGSAPVAAIRSADALPEPQVHARVSGRGAARVLTYDVKAMPGQEVRFREGSHAIGTARASHGRLRFTPAFGKGGTRAVVAEVTQDGFPRTSLVVSHYVAPRPATLRAPRRVTLRRRGERLAIRWSPVAGATKYEVGVFTGDGRVIGYEATRRSVTVHHLVGTRASRVIVRAVRADGKLGKAKVVRGGRGVR